MTNTIKNTTSLLIVDDDERIRRMLNRLLAYKFDALASAGTYGEAAEFAACHFVTHLISDFNLGPGEPDGFEIVTSLRKKHPGIQRAVIYTAETSLKKAVPPEVDSLVQKSGRLDELFKALAVGNT